MARDVEPRRAGGLDAGRERPGSAAPSSPGRAWLDDRRRNSSYRELLLRKLDQLMSFALHLHAQGPKVLKLSRARNLILNERVELRRSSRLVCCWLQAQMQMVTSSSSSFALRPAHVVISP
jgi:hypothetical protein